MSAVFKGAIAAALLAGSSLAGTAPAQAHDRTGTAIIAGIIGLGVGAAIASSDHHSRRDYGYSYGYDRAPTTYYGSAPSYYSYGYSQPSYYGSRYDRGYYNRERRDYYRDRRDYDRGGYDSYYGYGR